MNSLPPAELLLTKVAGILGAAASLAFVKGTWAERLTMAIGGAVLSLYATPWASERSGLPEGLAGFLLGLFGMAICDKAWRAIQSAPIEQAWTAILDIIKKRFGG